MRTLQHIEEFKREASNALFTKQQAISITLRLLELEANDPEGNEEDRATLLEAMEKTESQLTAKPPARMNLRRPKTAPAPTPQPAPQCTAKMMMGTMAKLIEPMARNWILK